MKEQDLREKFSLEKKINESLHVKLSDKDLQQCVQIAKDYADAQNKELVDCLKHLYDSCKPKDVTLNKCGNTYYVGSLSFPSEVAIHRTKKLLDQLFKNRENER